MTADLIILRIRRPEHILRIRRPEHIKALLPSSSEAGIMPTLS